VLEGSSTVCGWWILAVRRKQWRCLAYTLVADSRAAEGVSMTNEDLAREAAAKASRALCGRPGYENALYPAALEAINRAVEAKDAELRALNIAFDFIAEKEAELRERVEAKGKEIAEHERARVRARNLYEMHTGLVSNASLDTLFDRLIERAGLAHGGRMRVEKEMEALKASHAQAIEAAREEAQEEIVEKCAKIAHELWASSYPLSILGQAYNCGLSDCAAMVEKQIRDLWAGLRRKVQPKPAIVMTPDGIPVQCMKCSENGSGVCTHTFDW
jgi:hypothetical protein